MANHKLHPSLTDGTFDRLPGAQMPPREAGASASPPASAAQADVPDSGRLLFEADRTQKGQGPERLQVAVKEYSGHRYLDLRLWYRTQDGAWLPSKKGVTIRARELDEFQRAMVRAAELLRGSA